MAFTGRPRGWERTRQRILARDAYICRIPGCPDPGLRATSVDHIIPRVEGGTHDDANLRAAHLTCNASKGRYEGLPARPRGWMPRRKSLVGLPKSRPSRWS